MKKWLRKNGVILAFWFFFFFLLVENQWVKCTCVQGTDVGMLCSSGGRTITLEPEDAFESLQGLLPVGPKFSVSCHFSGFNFHQLNRDNDAHVLRCLGEWRKIRGKTQNSNQHRAGPQLRRNSPLLMRPLCFSSALKIISLYYFFSYCLFSWPVWRDGEWATQKEKTIW